MASFWWIILYNKLTFYPNREVRNVHDWTIRFFKWQFYLWNGADPDSNWGILGLESWYIVYESPTLTFHDLVSCTGMTSTVWPYLILLDYVLTPPDYTLPCQFFFYLLTFFVKFPWPLQLWLHNTSGVSSSVGDFSHSYHQFLRSYRYFFIFMN